MKRIDSSYKLIEFFSGKVVSAATVEFKLGTVVLIEKLVFNVVYEKIVVVGSHFDAHSHAVDLFVIIVREWKTVEC